MTMLAVVHISKRAGGCAGRLPVLVALDYEEVGDEMLMAAPAGPQ